MTTNLLTSHLTVPAPHSLRQHVGDIHRRLGCRSRGGSRFSHGLGGTTPGSSRTIKNERHWLLHLSIMGGGCCTSEVSARPSARRCAWAFWCRRRNWLASSIPHRLGHAANDDQREGQNRSPCPIPHGRTRMIVFPLRRSVGFKAATASSRFATLPMFVD